MFYCNECAKENSYPETMFKSIGICECCRTKNTCNERPSSLLPKPFKCESEKKFEKYKKRQISKRK